MQEFPLKHGTKHGLFRSRIGLSLMLKRALFHLGKIRVECVAELEEAVLVGSSDAANRHSIETLRLPEALKRERTEIFVGERHLRSCASSLLCIQETSSLVNWTKVNS